MGDGALSCSIRFFAASCFSLHVSASCFAHHSRAALPNRVSIHLWAIRLLIAIDFVLARVGRCMLCDVDYLVASCVRAIVEVNRLFSFAFLRSAHGVLVLRLFSCARRIFDF